MKTSFQTNPSLTLFKLQTPGGAAAAEPFPTSGKMAAAKKPKEEPEEEKKSIWKSALFGLATGVLSFFINVLPERIGKFLSHVFASMVKADNPFIKEAS